MNMEKLNQIIMKFSNERDWDKFHSPKNLAMALNVEASELMEIFQWETEEQSKILHQDVHLKERISDEVADVFIYLLRLCQKCEIDLELASLQKMVKNELKYPIEKSRGISKKYNDLG